MVKYLSNIKSKIKENTHPKIYKVVLTVLLYLILQWFFIGLGCFIALAHSYPNATKNVKISYWAVAIIFFISGIGMKTRDLLENMGNWRAHFTVLTLSFLVTSAIIYGICCGIKAAKNPRMSDWMLVGLIVTASCPTTVASNVVMTRQADGNEHLSLSEVVVGNLLGAFITPALAQMYLSGTWEFANPANGSSVGEVYRRVLMQIGLSVFVPLFVGQVVRNIFPKQCQWCMSTFKLNKVGTFMLLLIMWSSFCTAFRQHAFDSVPHASIIMIVFFNIGIYLFFTLISYLYARPAFLNKLFAEAPNEQSSNSYKRCYKIFKPFYYNRADTVSILLCGPAKTAALGVSLVEAQYGKGNEHLGTLLIPLVLYQAEQVFCAGIMTHFFKIWVHREEKVENQHNNADTENSIENESATHIESYSTQSEGQASKYVETARNVYYQNSPEEQVGTST